MITAGADIISVYHAGRPYNDRVERSQGPRAVLFDLDDTLFDHTHGARAALRGVYGKYECFHGRPFEELEEAHTRCLEELHLRVLAGDLEIDAARMERFQRLFLAAGVVSSEEQLAEAASAYRAVYVASRRAVEGALDLLATLQPRVRIGIVSNNLLDEQQDKVRLCGFDRYVDALVVSEEAGASKPDPAIFAIALARLECDRTEAVMIGDSWAADVEGARRTGIRPIWFNRTGLASPEPASGVTELAALSPIEPVLAAIFGDTQSAHPTMSVPCECPG
jgi:HAD superfamily hydrolase (TIGR01549 family)